MKKKRWRTSVFFISQILLSQARILDPSFFGKLNNRSDSEEGVIIDDDEVQIEHVPNEEVIDDLSFIQSFLISVPNPPSTDLNKEKSNDDKIKIESSKIFDKSDTTLTDQSKSTNYDLFMSIFLNNTLSEAEAEEQQQLNMKHPHTGSDEEEEQILFDTSKIDRRMRKLSARNRGTYTLNDIPSEDPSKVEGVEDYDGKSSEVSQRRGKMDFVDHQPVSFVEETSTKSKFVDKDQDQILQKKLAQDRRFLIPFSVIDVDFVEAKYQSIIIELPKQIDEARDVIIQDIATKNMLGYTIIAAYMFGMVFDIVGFSLLEFKSLGETIESFITDKGTFGLFNWFGWYAFGYAGPWFFPSIFNGGDPNLQCSSSDYLELLGKHDLTLDIQSFTELSDVQATILTERFQRDFNRRLECILGKKSSYKEALRVSSSFQSLSRLVYLHNDLQGSNIPQGQNDVLDLDLELEKVWGDIILLTDQVYDEVISRRAHTAVVYVFIGILNVMGMVGANIFYYSVIENHFNKDKLDKDGNLIKEMDVKEGESSAKIEDILQEIFQWILSDGVDSHFIQVVGATIFFAAPFGWGYSYWMQYFLFLETVDPGCGSMDRDDVYNK